MSLNILFDQFGLEKQGKETFLIFFYENYELTPF